MRKFCSAVVRFLATLPLLCPAAIAQPAQPGISLNLRDYFAAGSDASTTTTAALLPGNTIVKVKDPSSFAARQGVLIRGAGSQGSDYLGVVAAVTQGGITVSPAISTAISVGSPLRHNDSAAFESAISTLRASRSGGRLYVPRGTYNLDAIALQIDFNNFTLEGEGRGATIIKYSGSQCALSGTTGAKALQYHLAFRFFSILAASPGGSGICLYRTMYAVIQETYIENTAAGQTGHALLLDGSHAFGTGVIVANNRFNQWRTAVLFTGDPAGGYMVRSRLADNEIDGKSPFEPGSVGVELDLCQNCEIDGGNLEHWDTGIRLTRSALQNVIEFVRFEEVHTIWDIAGLAKGTQTLGNMFASDGRLIDMSGTTTLLNDQSGPGRFVSRMSANGLMDSSTARKPLCDVDHRGEIYVEKGPPRVADEPFLCVKKSDDSYTWIQLANVP